MSCIYKGCKSRRRAPSATSFFQFPSDYRRLIWIKHSGIPENVVLTKTVSLCEKHFYKKDLILRGVDKKLNKTSIPISDGTICNCTENSIDAACFKIMHFILNQNAQNWSKMKEAKNITSSPLLASSAVNVDVENRIQYKRMSPYHKTIIVPYKSNPKDAVPTSSSSSSKIVEKPSPHTKEAVASSSDLSDQDHNTSTRKDQEGTPNVNKEIECLEAVVQYTSKMQSIVKDKGQLDSIIQANSHLISLLDKVVYEWFQRAQKRPDMGVITDEMIIKKALESKNIFCIKSFDPDREWLNKFKKKHHINDVDMILLHVEKNKSPLTVDIHEIVLYVLECNPVEKYFSSKTYRDYTRSRFLQTAIEKIHKPDEDIDMEIRTKISNDEQARHHLKPLEEYVLLKDNFGAMGLLSQLADIFSQK